MSLASQSPDTVPELLDSLIERSGDDEAFVDGERRLTFAQWGWVSEGVARLFAGAGVGRGSVVCLQLPSSIDYAVCYMAAMRIGAVTSGINPRLGAAEVASILDRTRPRVTVVASRSQVVRPDQAGKVLTVEEVRAAFDAGPCVRVRLDPADPVAVVWTSGTTGVPKGAVYSHRNLAAVARATGDLSADGDRRLSPLPFSHVGYMTRPWDEISRRITTVIVPTPWRASTALSLIEKEKVTVAQGVPAQWRLMLADPAFASTSFASLRVAGTGASAVPPELVRTLRSRLGCPIVVGYASTETAVIARSAIGDSDEDVARTVGQAAEGVSVRVVPVADLPLGSQTAVPSGSQTAVPSGEVGTVQVRSEAAMTGYWGDPVLTAASITPDGWIVTGDLGYLDDRGYLTLVGRTTEMYIRGGYNVYPVEVEAALVEHPAVVQAAVVGASDPVLGEVGVAFVVLDPSPQAPGTSGASLAFATSPGGRWFDELRSWCRARLADYKAPDVVEVVDELPLTTMSKVDKASLAGRAAKLADGRRR